MCEWHILLKLSTSRPLQLCLVCYNLFKCQQSDLKGNLIMKYKEIKERRTTNRLTLLDLGALNAMLFPSGTWLAKTKG